jgi:hypothetical protein
MSAPRHASSRFLIKMFFVFFERTEPASSMAKPVCMKKTRTPAHSRKKVSPFAAIAAGPLIPSHTTLAVKCEPNDQTPPVKIRNFEAVFWNGDAWNGDCNKLYNNGESTNQNVRLR